MAVVLDYKLPLGENARRRRCMALLAIVSFLSISLAIWKDKSILAALKLQYYQRQCLRFERPETAVAFDSDQFRMAAAAANDPAYVSNGRQGYGYKPASLAFFALSGLVSNTPSIIFMHERLSPGGHRRLVLVMAPEDVDLRFQRVPWVPVNWFGSGKQLNFSKLADTINYGNNVLLDDPPFSWGYGTKTRPDLKRDSEGRLQIRSGFFLVSLTLRMSRISQLNMKLARSPGSLMAGCAMTTP